MRTRTLIISALVTLGALAPGLLAQDDPWANLEAVDPGTVDVGPLGESLRIVPIDMRLNDEFSRIYRLEGVDGWEDRFARRDGALTAIFSQSVYLPASLGGGVVIPAGTVFIIGDPPEWVRERYALEAPPEQTGAGALSPDTRILTGMDVAAIDTRAMTPSMTIEPGSGDHLYEGMRRPPTPWRTDERRANRVSSLLSLASTGG